MTEKATAKKAEKKADSQSSKRKIEYSNPFAQKTVSLNTTPAQMAFDAAFEDCAESMRSLSTILPTIIKNQSDMMAVNGAVDHLINTTMAELRKEIAQIKKIADDNGIEMGKLNYTNVVSVDAQLTCYKAGQYLQIIVELDELMCLVHSAWFAGFIQDDAKSSMERKWRRKVIGVASEIKGITNRAFKAANSKATDQGQEEEGLGLSDGEKIVASDALGESESTVSNTKPTRTKKADPVQPAEATESVVA